MNLTFNDGNFVIRNPISCEVLSRPWQKITGGDHLYTTRDIQAAVKFRRYADQKAENIFKKLMLKRYQVPFGPPLVPEGLTLFPFQRDRGVPFILGNNRSYLAHQPGLGKSAQAIAAVNTKPGKALIICPAFLTMTWAREITKWALGFPHIEIVPGTTKQTSMDWKADYIICPDSMLMRPWVVKGLYKSARDYVFVDEAHRFKTQDASRTIALFGGQSKRIKSPGLIYNASHVSFLSGTPMLNRPIELWPVLYAAAPELIGFMSYMDFGFRYGGARQDQLGHWIFPGSSHEVELHDRICPFIQRITKAQVLPDLPPKIRQVVTMTEDNRPIELRKLDQSLAKELSGVAGGVPQELGEYAMVRHENGLAKVEWSAQFIADALQGTTDSIIVFAHHRQVVAHLAARLHNFKPMVINGGVDQFVRTEIQDAFQSGLRRLLIGNIDAMNLGLTLTKATRVIFVEYSWTPALNEQAEDRAHRIGQADSVFAQYIVLPGSIDEVILNTLLAKEKRIERVIE